MPPSARVPVDEAVAVIVQFGVHFTSDQLPVWSSKVWDAMSTAVGGKWDRNCFYTNVKKNRRNILGLARQKMNVTVSKTDVNNNFSLDETVMSEAVTSSSSDNDSWEAYHVRNNNKNLETFDVVLTEEEWTLVKPQPKSSPEEQRVKLTPKVWTNVVARAMWLQYRMPCAFVFKRADVSLSADERSYAIHIIGKCKSRKCGNTFDADATKNISIGGLTLKVLTEDTRGKQHEVVKRPLNGKRRKEVQTELKSEGCTVWKRRQARKLMQPGDIESPIIPHDCVIRQTCKEGFDAELDVKKSDSRDLIRTIEELSMNPEYCGIIHSVASQPFHVFYSAPAQLHAYKEYCRLNRDSSFICIDATGSVVKPLDRPDGSKSGHIFLYSIVINFDGTTIAVNQMLSEQHDTEFIEYWLRRWLRAGAPKPKEVVCDYSRALLSGLCLALNNLTLQNYVRCCFSRITKSRIHLSLPEPSTILSVDVAHLIHLVCRWKCFKSLSHTSVKEFFVRCVALMVDCVSFADFTKVFSLTCAVGAQMHEDAGLDITHASTTKEARRKLENLIATWGIQIDLNTKDLLKERVKDRPASSNPIDLEEPINGSESNIHRWINQEVTKANITLSVGEDLNPFYLPEFVRNLTRLCLEFPLWTGVGKKTGNRHATSSYVEAYFNYIKNKVFRNKKRPIRVDKFIKTHARDIAGATLLGSAKLLQSNIARQIPEQVSEDAETESAPQEIIDPDLLSSEDWRKKAKPHDPMNLNLTPINWNVTPDLISLGKRPVETTSTPLNDLSQNNEFMCLALADHSYSKIDEITGLDNFMDDACSGKTSSAPNRNLPLDEEHEKDLLSSKADHSYSKIDEITGLDNFMDDACSGKTSSAPNRNLPLDEEHEKDLLSSKADHSYSKIDEITGLDNFMDDSCSGIASVPPNKNSPLDQKHKTDLLNFEERCQPGKTSKFFGPHPEVRHQNANLSSNQKKAVLLPNGLRCRAVKVNGESIFVHKTCSFDSFAQILLTAAIDNDKYFALIQSSTNKTFQLVHGLIQKGVTQRTYLDRALILKQFCPITVNTSTKTRVISYVIDGELSIAELVEKLMQSEPSTTNIEECSHCGLHPRNPSILMAPNHKTIGRLGFNGLQAALDFHSPIYKIRCRDPCTGTYTLSRELNNHLFIEMDIRPNLQATSGLKCKLGQMPVTLHLGQSAEITHEYRLVGIVAHLPGHYVAYCRRKGSWELYNDLSIDVRKCGLDTEIDPHLAVYVRTDTLSY